MSKFVRSVCAERRDQVHTMVFGRFALTDVRGLGQDSEWERCYGALCL